MSHTPADLRNVVLMGHADGGKTSLVEAMLHQTGKITRLGSVPAGSTTTDFDPDEKKAQHSLFTKMAHTTFEGVALNLIDTPGYPDFFAETHCAALAGDIALIVINAKTGIGLNTRAAWKLADKHGLARVIAVNKCDTDNVDLEALTKRIRESFGNGCVWFRPPAATGAGYKGNGDGLAAGSPHREGIVEAAVETDDELMEKYLEQGEVSPEELQKGIAAGIRAGKLVPMVATSATGEVGVKDLLGVLKDYAPSPLQARRRKAADGKEVDPSGPFLAQVFKVFIGDYGAQNYIRVFAGEAEGGGSLHNLTSGKDDRVGDFQRALGKTLEPLHKLVAGDIAIVPKVDTWHTGDSLSVGAGTRKMPVPQVPQPMVALAVKPRTSADEVKLRPALDKLQREDLSFQTVRNEETHELLVKGMSSLHLETTLHRLKERFKVDVDRAPPRIAYRETIRGKGDARYRHKKQSGGAGEFGEVAIRLLPTERGSGFVFENCIVGGVISGGFIPAVEKGIEEAMSRGVVAGYKFVDCKVELYDGKEHDVDSKEVAFKKAGAGAFKEAVKTAKPAILEPIMSVEITVPEDYTGDIMGDLARRRAQPQGMEPGDPGTTVIKAIVPESELLTYSQDLRSMTSGEGTYTMTPSHYEFLPPEKAQALIEAYVHPEPDKSGRLSASSHHG